MDRDLYYVAGCGSLHYQTGNKKYAFDVFEQRTILKEWQYTAVIICYAASAAVHWLSWGGFKPALEFQNLGLMKFLFQYCYYACEPFLCSIMIVFGQKACEICFKKQNIPYGGIVLALTWGLMHIFSKGSLAVGMLSAAGGFLYGSAYLIIGRDYSKTLPLLARMFIL